MNSEADGSPALDSPGRREGARCAGQVGVARHGDFLVQRMPWGSLTWKVSAACANSDTLTVGRCIIDVDQANERHYHPNCDEVLEVLTGSIAHSYGDGELELHAGDVISIPAGVVHNARNIGSDKADLLICFSSAERITLSETST